MAILQSRMIALINAAMDYQQGLRQLQKLIHDANNRVQQASPHEQEENAKIELLGLVLKSNDLNLLEDSGKAQATITGEHYRFAVNKKRNEWNRQYQERRRGGITQKHHIEPDYATEEFNTITARVNPFRSKNQTQKGFTQKTTDIDYIPGELPEETRRKIDKQIAELSKEKASEENTIVLSDEVVDPNFPADKPSGSKDPFGDL